MTDERNDTMTTEQMDEKDGQDSASRRAEQMADVRARLDPASPDAPWLDKRPEPSQMDPDKMPKRRPMAFRPDLRDDGGALPGGPYVPIGKVREHITDDSPCWCGPQVAHVAADEPAQRDMSITDITSYSEDTMFKVQAAITSLGYSGQPVLDLIGAMQNAGILFREHGPDQEEHTHYTDRATRLCAEGDHDSAVMWDRDAERVKVRESEATLVAPAGWCTPSDQVYSFLPTAKEAKAARKKAKKARRKARKEGRVLFDEWTVKRGGIQFTENVEATMAEEPINDRLRRAWLNGFKEGVDRAANSVESWGRWDS